MELGLVLLEQQIDTVSGGSPYNVRRRVEETLFCAVFQPLKETLARGSSRFRWFLSQRLPSSHQGESAQSLSSSFCQFSRERACPRAALLAVLSLGRTEFSLRESVALLLTELFSGRASARRSAPFPTGHLISFHPSETASAEGCHPRRTFRRALVRPDWSAAKLIIQQTSVKARVLCRREPSTP